MRFEIKFSLRYCVLFCFPYFFRLYPVIPANARVIPERDIQVGGYLIPKNVSSPSDSSQYQVVMLQFFHYSQKPI